jgi:hypothetical protein
MNENLTAAIGKLALAADPAGSWSTWVPAVLGSVYPFVSYYLSMARRAEKTRSCATRKTLEKRLRYHNRKGKSAARRLGITWVRLRTSDVEFGSSCPFCALPRPKNESLIRACRDHDVEKTGSAFCPRESLDLCAACGTLYARERGACHCAAEKVPA